MEYDITVIILDFDSSYSSSILDAPTNGVFGLTVKSFACEAKNESSILSLHPKAVVTEMALRVGLRNQIIGVRISSTVLMHC